LVVVAVGALVLLIIVAFGVDQIGWLPVLGILIFALACLSIAVVLRSRSAPASDVSTLTYPEGSERCTSNNSVLDEPSAAREPPRSTSATLEGESTSARLRHFIESIKVEDPGLRLAIRVHPVLIRLGDELVASRVSDLAAVLTSALVSASQLGPPQAVARVLEHAEGFDQGFARAYATALASEIMTDLSHELEDAVPLASNLPDSNVHDVHEAIAHARSLSANNASADDLATAIASARDLALAVAQRRTFDLDGAQAIARALDLDDPIGIATVLAAAPELDRHSAASLAQNLDDARNDFADADLSRADLNDVSMTGVRWTTTTRWPEDWVDRVVLDSQEIAPGVFEIGPGAARAPALA
jgi:hypothetical protein